MKSIKTIFNRRLFEQIGTEYLEEFLLPIKDYLVGQGLWKGENGKFPENLANALQSAYNCPKEGLNKVETTLHILGLITDKNLADIDEIKDALKTYDPSENDFKLACRLIVENPKAAEEIAASTFREQTFNGEYYIPSCEHSDFKCFSDEQIKKISEKLSGFFKDEGKDPFLGLFQHDCDEHIYLCIDHGLTKMVEVSVDNNTTKPFSYRPITHDIIRIKKSNCEVLFHLEKPAKRTLNRYKMYIGDIIVPRGELTEYRKFDLSSLKKGKDVLNCDSIHGLILVSLRKFCFKKKNSKYGTLGGPNCIEEAEKLGKENVTFSSAVFEFLFDDGVRLILNISNENKAKIPISAKTEIIEEYFLSKDILKPDRYERTLPISTK